MYLHLCMYKASIFLYAYEYICVYPNIYICVCGDQRSSVFLNYPLSFFNSHSLYLQFFILFRLAAPQASKILMSLLLLLGL